MSGAVAFLVNGGPDSAMGQRARTFAAGLADAFHATVHYREGTRGRAFAHYARVLRSTRPSIVYVLDVTLPAIGAAYWHRRRAGCRLVVDTGDATADLIAGQHRIGRVGHRALDAYERAALRHADAVVVRGTLHSEHLSRLGLGVSAVIPDGVDMECFRPADAGDLRRALRLFGQFTVGVVGSLNWNARLRWTPGLELVEALAAVRSPDVGGLIIGSGSGLPRLRERAEALGVANRLTFVDEWLDPVRLAAHINCMDIGLSTQTNNLVGQVRTTGKLPLFLASGTFVIASQVGEAARVLPAPMLLEYAGDFDPGYPARLAVRIDEVHSRPELLSLGAGNRAIAAAEFDYRVLVPRVRQILEKIPF